VVSFARASWLAGRPNNPSSPSCQEKARKVEARYRGVCRGCGGATAARGGKDDAYEFCKQCHPGATGRGLARLGAGGDARVAGSLRRAAVVDRLVAQPCPLARRAGARTAARRGPALLLHRHRPDGTWAAARADAFPDE